MAGKKARRICRARITTDLRTAAPATARKPCRSDRSSSVLCHQSFRRCLHSRDRGSSGICRWLPWLSPSSREVLLGPGSSCSASLPLPVKSHSTAALLAPYSDTREGLERSEHPAWRSQRPGSDGENGERAGHDHVPCRIAAHRVGDRGARHVEENAGVRPFLE